METFKNQMGIRTKNTCISSRKEINKKMKLDEQIAYQHR